MGLGKHANPITEYDFAAAAKRLSIAKSPGIGGSRGLYLPRGKALILPDRGPAFPYSSQIRHSWNFRNKRGKYVKMNNWLTVAKEYMRVMLSDRKQISGIDNARPTYDVMLQLYYESVLQPGDVAIDVGAHMGGHTFPIAKSVFPSGRVYAFEPLSTCRETLQERMKSDYAEYQEIIDVYPCALSDYQGPSEFVVVIDDPAYSGLRKRTYDTTSNLRRISVTVQTIDALFQQLPSLEFIKIDAEGAEFDIMKGAHKVLKKFRPFIAFEFGANSIKEYETTPKSTYEYIKKLDYMLFDILGNEITDSAQFQKSANDQHVWDYIALPEEDRMLKQKTRKTLRSLQDGTIEVA